MATQGVVSVVKNGEVIFKIVAGCDGYNAKKLVDYLKETPEEELYPQNIANMADIAGFGCGDCLVIIDDFSEYIYSGEPLHKRYRETFKDAKFNPRWELGTADHVEVLNID